MDNGYGIDITCTWYRVRSVGYVVWVVSTKFHSFQSSLLVVEASKLLPWKFGMTVLLTLSFSILCSVSGVSGALIRSVWGSWGITVATFELFPFPFPLTFFLVGWCNPSSKSSITAASGRNQLLRRWYDPNIEIKAFWNHLTVQLVGRKQWIDQQQALWVVGTLVGVINEGACFPRMNHCFPLLICVPRTRV